MVIEMKQVDRKRIMQTFFDLSNFCNDYAEMKGFNKLFRRIPRTYRPFMFLNLIHDEVSEASEFARDDDMKEFAKELAGLLFRIFHVCGFYNLPMGKLFIEECERNMKRPEIHGRKVI